MNKAERKELSTILYGLASNFGDSLNEFALELWVNAFREDGITISQIREAAGHILRTRKISKMPTYAEFKEAVQGSNKDRAEIQADVVLEFAKYNGAVEPRFADEVTQHLMTTRWPFQRWAATVREDEVKWWRKEFVEAYQTYSRVGVKVRPQIEGAEKVKALAETIGKGAEVNGERTE